MFTIIRNRFRKIKLFVVKLSENQITGWITLLCFCFSQQLMSTYIHGSDSSCSHDIHFLQTIVVKKVNVYIRLSMPTTYLMRCIKFPWLTKHDISCLCVLWTAKAYLETNKSPLIIYLFDYLFWDIYHLYKIVIHQSFLQDSAVLDLSGVGGGYPPPLSTPQVFIDPHWFSQKNTLLTPSLVLPQI